MIHVDATLFESSVSGIIPAVGVVVGGAVVGLIRGKQSQRAKDREADAEADKSINGRLKVVEEFISGKDEVKIGNRVITAATPGFEERFGTLEGTVGTLVVSVDNLARAVNNGNGK